jgi:hypothetical protein
MGLKLHVGHLMDDMEEIEEHMHQNITRTAGYKGTPWKDLLHIPVQ